MTDEMNAEAIGEGGFEPNRQRVDIQVGAYVQDDNAVYRIEEVIDHTGVLGTNLETGRRTTLRIQTLRPLDNDPPRSPAAELDLDEIGDEDWRTAQQRYAAIKPLLGPWKPGRARVEERAQETGVGVATLYRWLNDYQSHETITALIPQSRGWRKGRRRISYYSEQLVQEVIKDFFQTKQRPNGTKVIREVKRRAYQRGIEAPSPATIRNRIAEVSEKTRLRAQGYRDRARSKYQPNPGQFPGGDYPLEVVQIDHTQADIMLVDDHHRKPIGRPWVTVAIDIYSRMVTGYYLSLEAPSEVSVGMCVSHSVLPKDDWLILHDIDAEWPVWGFPDLIHVDNGADFRSADFQRSCERYGIDVQYRPVKRPEYGGHIERLLGNFMDRVHELPGTTHSSIVDKEGYDPEKHATMTLAEFERWFVLLICKDYHENIHSGLGMSPRKQWEIGIFGNAEVTGTGLPPRPVDRHSIQLDFLPAFHRTVQTMGVTIDNLTYYDEALRPWLHAPDPDNPNKKRNLVFRRDPRDISVIWFFDPELERYFRIPLANQAIPPMSVWEHRRARERLKERGEADFNENRILQALTEMRAEVASAEAKTKKARRQSQQRKIHESRITPAEPHPGSNKEGDASSAPGASGGQPDSGFVDDDVPDFGDFG